MRHLIVYIMLDYCPPFDQIETVDHQEGWSSSLGVNAINAIVQQYCLISHVRILMAGT